MADKTISDMITDDYFGKQPKDKFVLYQPGENTTCDCGSYYKLTPCELDKIVVMTINRFIHALSND